MFLALMKKGFSIFITALILISGMHLSMASHLCQGEVVAVKWSFSGKMAGCGMEAPANNCPIHDGIASDCCQNKIAYFTTDNSYIPSNLQIKDIVSKFVKAFDLPVYSIANPIKQSVSLCTNVSPPDAATANKVNLAGICVFRI